MIDCVEGFEKVNEEGVAWKVVFLAELQHSFYVRYCVSGALFEKATALFFEHVADVGIHACGDD